MAQVQSSGFRPQRGKHRLRSPYGLQFSSSNRKFPGLGSTTMTLASGNLRRCKAVLWTASRIVPLNLSWVAAGQNYTARVSLPAWREFCLLSVGSRNRTPARSQK